MKILILIEHDNKNVKASNYHTLTAARELGNDIDCIVMGYQCESVVDQCKTLPYIKTVYHADHKDYEYQLAENVSTLLCDYAKDYQYLLSGATTFGKNILPRVAALLNVGVISDVIKIVSSDTFVRPIYAGNALAEVQSQDSIKILSIRTTAFALTLPDNNHHAEVVKIDKVIENDLSQFINHELTVSARPELTGAKIVISGGRGLKSAENFKLLEKLADKLGAALGASRAAVDAGFAPNDYQVGQTGKVVAPDLYIAIGISGAIQHLAGMKDSKTIVAINNDPDAPIFQIADYGLVMDLFTAIEELNKELA